MDRFEPTRDGARLGPWPSLPDDSGLWAPSEVDSPGLDEHRDLLDREQRGIRWNA